jgi:hypothetical protein
MAEDYTVALRISVFKGPPESMVATEESTFANINFAKMTKISSDFYELIAKLEKERNK